MKKMILVPEALIDTVTRKDRQHSTAELDQVVRLDKQIEELLQRKDLPLHDKVAKYNYILQQYLHFRDEMLKTSTPAAVVTPPTTMAMATATDDTPTGDASGEPPVLAAPVETIPQRYRSKASRILRLLKDSGVGTWSKESNEFIYKGQAVPGSNIYDLLYHTTVPNQRPLPEGIHQFVNALNESNVPHLLRAPPRQQPAVSFAGTERDTTTARKRQRTTKTDDVEHPWKRPVASWLT
jgi:hypothetical protein